MFPVRCVEHAIETADRDNRGGAPLQFEMCDVLNPVGRKRENSGRHHGRRPPDAEDPGEPIHREARRDDAEEQDRVVDGRQRRAAPDGGRREGTLQQRRVRQQVGQRFRMEDVGIEQVFARTHRMSEPPEAPHAQQRIDVADDVGGRHASVRPRDSDRCHTESECQQEVLGELRPVARTGGHTGPCREQTHSFV